MAKRLVRPIQTERDYKGAARAAKGLRERSVAESAEERRLQALIKELERFDNEDMDDDSGDAADDIQDLPSRRWSDDQSET